MNAPLPLKMLLVRPICIPTYRNGRIHVGYGPWYLDNHGVLEDYYNSLNLYTEGEPLGDFDKFCRDQYRDELARVITLERVLPHGGDHL